MSTYASYQPYDNQSDTYGSTYGASGYPYDPPMTGYSESTTSSSSSSSKRRTEYTSYFVPGYGISRQVIFNHYQYLLGPSATIKPFSFQKREGYMITNAGSPLTKNQIEDLKRMSLEYEEKEAIRMMSRSGSVNSNEVYVNQPIPVQQRRHYVPESPHGAR
ncbi:MAG: hypothetical protein Q9217_004375 [Psora testacea]